MNNLENAASLSVAGNTVTVTNLTGHKLISGYPEGRRMWLNIKWYGDAAETILLREDGKYGTLPLGYDIDGVAGNDSVQTLLELHDPNTRVYEAHGAITQNWAAILNSLGLGGVPVNYDRETGLAGDTVADVAALPNPDDYIETFHFVLNNKVVMDNRIPPYGMDYDESLVRSILPVPATQYGDPGPGGTFNHWDDFTMNPPGGAHHAEIRLMYQPTSWEYIQFLDLANNGSVAHLANEGTNLLDAWINTGMAAPHEMASISWTPPDTDGDGISDTQDNCPSIPNNDQLDTDSDSQGDVCDDDDDNDGLTDVEEGTAGTNPLLFDTDGDTLGDGDEVTAGTNPLLADSDGDSYNDNIDPVPTLFNEEDGDVAPYGTPDGNLNTGDLLVGIQLILGIKNTTDLELSHLDLYPVGAPDGEITLSDYILQQKLAW